MGQVACRYKGSSGESWALIWGPASGQGGVCEWTGNNHGGNYLEVGKTRVSSQFITSYCGFSQGSSLLGLP